MRSKKYKTAFDNVKLFCNNTNGGIVVAEINSCVTKKHFFEDLSIFFDVRATTTSEMSQRDINLNDIDDSSIIVIDESNNNDVKKSIVNLNYNRDWLLSHRCNIIIVLPTFAVNELISYSYSFWSCVSLHEIFNSYYHGIIHPEFIDKEDSWYKSNKNQYAENKNTVSDIVYNIFHKKAFVTNSKDSISDFLKGEYKQYENRKVLYEKIYAFVQLLSENKYYAAAYVCYEHLYSNFNKILENDKLKKIKLYESVVKFGYNSKDYELAKTYCAMLIQFIEELKEDDPVRDIISDMDIAIYWNNLGCLWLLTDNFEMALTDFNISGKAMNDLIGNSYYSDIIFNLALVSYLSKDYNKAMYYIDIAISDAETFSNRWYKITQTRYYILKAHININQGNLLEIKDALPLCLELLRNELPENHKYIMEVHYVNALSYLFQGNVERAYSCAIKALAIAKKINISQDKIFIWELLGEILFESENYPEAQKMMKLVIARKKEKHWFDEEQLDIAKQILDYSN